MNDVQVPLAPIVQKLAQKLVNAEIKIASLESYIDMLQGQAVTENVVQPVEQHNHVHPDFNGGV